MAKITGLKQLFSKKYKFLADLPEEIKASFGDLVENFIMIIWGASGQGKSNLIMLLLKVLMKYDSVLYVALEEATSSTMQALAIRHLNVEEHSKKIKWAETDMTYEELIKQLSKKKQPRFIVIDSLQYWNISYDQYKFLKEKFPSKTFIYISHAKGKSPDGVTADKIRYDAGIKVRVEGGVAFPISRYGGNKPFVIHEPKARDYWKKKYNEVVKGMAAKSPPKRKKKAVSEVAD